MERLCRGMAEASRVPGEAIALLELAEDYGREAAKRTVVRAVDATHPEKARNISKVDRTPLFRQYRGIPSFSGSTAKSEAARTDRLLPPVERHLNAAAGAR